MAKRVAAGKVLCGSNDLKLTEFAVRQQKPLSSSSYILPSKDILMLLSISRAAQSMISFATSKQPTWTLWTLSKMGRLTPLHSIGPGSAGQRLTHQHSLLEALPHTFGSIIPTMLAEKRLRCVDTASSSCKRSNAPCGKLIALCQKR